MKRDEVTEGWRKLHNEELQNLYSSPSIIIMIKARRKRWARYVALNGEKRNEFRGLVRKPERKRPLGRPRRRCDDNIKMDLREMEWRIIELIDLTQDREQWMALVNAVMNLHKNLGNS
jgi:hypothetical protein